MSSPSDIPRDISGDTPNANPSRPVMQLLARGLQLWVRQQCQSIDSLEIRLEGSPLQLLRGRLAGVRLLARRVVYQQFHLELVELASGPIQVHVGNLLRGQPLQLEQAFQIQRDIEYGEFDATYERYKIQSALTTVTPPSTISIAVPTLSDLWNNYSKAKKSGKSPATVRMYGWVANHLERCPYKLLTESQAVFDWFVSNIPADSAKRVMMHLSACCKWAKKSSLTDSDPFYGMASEIKLKKVGNEEIEIDPFSRKERDCIIAV